MVCYEIVFIPPFINVLSQYGVMIVYQYSLFADYQEIVAFMYTYAFGVLKHIFIASMLFLFSPGG